MAWNYIKLDVLVERAPCLLQFPSHKNKGLTDRLTQETWKWDQGLGLKVKVQFIHRAHLKAKMLLRSDGKQKNWNNWNGRIRKYATFLKRFIAEQASFDIRVHLLINQVTLMLRLIGWHGNTPNWSPPSGLITKLWNRWSESCRHHGDSSGKDNNSLFWCWQTDSVP